MYLAGVVGLSLPYSKPIFLKLTAFNLWVSMILLLFFHENWSKKAVITFSCIFISGFLVELIGVKTGAFFGNYKYGQTLGLKLFDVPIAIGANWLVLTYIFSYFSQICFKEKKYNEFVLALISSCCMVILDFLIEPIAVKYNFWRWQGNVIPLQNYLGWFVFGFLFCFIIQKQKIIFKNNLALLLLILQAIFFLTHNLLSIAFYLK